jgi:hypothetical protein
LLQQNQKEEGDNNNRSSLLVLGLASTALSWLSLQALSNFDNGVNAK